ncbi:MAG TPA: efflux RND transporter permease subunit, partial [Tepidisphaeraceae bacterium]|nr:efflux RND transporter permease subunit [Tepidisphaeraceae bacterium]
LRAYDLPLGTLYSAIAGSNMSVGGKVIVENGSEYVIRGVGWLKGVKDLESVVVASRNGTPIYLKDVAAVQMGPEFRRSAMEKDGREVVGGVVMMRYGENPLEVTKLIKQKIRELQAGLPDGVRVVPFYDRTRLIESAIHTVTGTLKEEMIIASIAILLILTHFRSAVVVCVTLPMAVLISFLFMFHLGLPSNIMSLCGIAISIGILVDAAVVMVENASHELKVHFGNEKVHGDTTEIVVKACRLVGRPIFFSVVIMLISFLPVFTFSGQEGKLSHPLAFTKSFAMVGVAVLAITLVPALIPLFVRGRIRGEEENWIVRSFIHIYRPVLAWMIDRPGVVWWTMGVILAIGAAFMGVGWMSVGALAFGLISVILGVRRDGWTMWLLVGLVVLVLILVAGQHDRLFASVDIPLVVQHSLLWIIVGTAAGIILLAMGLGHWRTAAVASLLVVTFVADTRLRKLGSEFMPSLNEGSILDMPTTSPRIAMGQAVDDVMVRDRVLRSFPEVDEAVGKIGRAETATDPSPLDMVETIVTLRPVEEWPKRKMKWEDTLRQAGVLAAELQKRGILKSDGIAAEDWPNVVRAVGDADYLKRNAKYTAASELLNTAASVAQEKFDETMRELTRRRQREYEPELANQLVAMAYDQLLTHIQGLPERDGKRALLRMPSEEERQQILETGRRHGTLLVEVPRQEEVDKLLGTLRAELVRRGIAADRDDLLLDHPGAVAGAVRSLQQAIGMQPASFAERLMQQIEMQRDRLWAERTKILNWELFDYAPGMMNDYLLDRLVATAKGTSLEGKAADAAALRTIRDEQTPALAKGLFLWQKSKDDVLKEMDSELQMPGWGNAWTQPIINRVNMLATGVRTQIGVKVFGPTGKPMGEAIDEIQRVSQKIAAKLRTVSGAVDVVADQAVGKRYLEITIDREKAARYGVNMSELSQVVETALGGARITTTVEGRQRFPVRLRYVREHWQDLDGVKDVLVTAQMTPVQLLDFEAASGGGTGAAKPAGGKAGGTALSKGGMGGGMNTASSGGEMAEASGSGTPSRMDLRMPAPGRTAVQIPLKMVADIRVVEGPSMIKSENGRLRNYVTLNVRGRDILGFVDEARQAIKPIEQSLAGSGMSIEWSGEFEHQVRARQTLMVIFPMTILIILFLLYVTFTDFLDTLLVFLAVLGAMSGAVMFQAAFGFNFSVVVSIGYIAAFGMATETGVIMLVYLREAVDRRGGLKGIGSLEELRTAVIEGAVHRLRPKLLTEGVAIVGLVPMLWATGTGAEIMRPMAAPVLGGLLISDEVIDLMIPVLFYAIRKRRWKKMHQEETPVSEQALVAV